MQNNSLRHLDWIVSKAFKLLYGHIWNLYNIWEMDLAFKSFMAMDRYLPPSIGKKSNIALVLLLALSEIDLVVHTRFPRIKILRQGFWRMKPDLYCYFFYLLQMFRASKSFWKGPRDDVWRPAWAKESQNKEAVLILYYSLYGDGILF